MNLKKIFITGFIFLLPTLITIFILVVVFRFLNPYASFLGGTILYGIDLIVDLPTAIKHSSLVKSLIGFPIALLIILIVGYLMTTLIGWRTFYVVEKYIIKQFPIISFIYPYAKQFTEIIWSKDEKTEFKAVVAVQYPRKGIYSIGFIASEGLKDINVSSEKQNIIVFIPSSPVPFTGYAIMFPTDEIIKLDMTVDEAIRFVISGGILTP